MLSVAVSLICWRPATVQVALLNDAVLALNDQLDANKDELDQLRGTLDGQVRRGVDLSATLVRIL
jgi:hypothetical protein